MMWLVAYSFVSRVLSSADQQDVDGIIQEGFALAQSAGRAIFFAYEGNRSSSYVDDRLRAAAKALELGLDEEHSSKSILAGERAINVMIATSTGHLRTMPDVFATTFANAYRSSLEKKLLPPPQEARPPPKFIYVAPVALNYPPEAVARAEIVSQAAATEASRASLLIAKAYNSDTSLYVAPKRQLATEVASRMGLNMQATVAGITGGEKAVGVLIAVPGSRLDRLDEVFADRFVFSYRADMKRQVLEGLLDDIDEASTEVPDA